MNQRFCNGMIHVIKSGDNLYQLSRKYRVPLALILRANPYVDVYNLQPGQEICIPMNRPPAPRPMPGRPGPMPGRPGAGPGPDCPGPEPGPELMPERPMSERPMPGESMSGRPEAREMEEGEPVAEYEDHYDDRRNEASYYTGGTKSLGTILKDCGLSVEEFFARNDPDRIIIAPDVMLDVPKKV